MGRVILSLNTRIRTAVTRVTAFRERYFRSKLAPSTSRKDLLSSTRV